jgi:hypothetical protein
MEPQTRRLQYEVARRVLETAPARDYEIGIDDYNAAFRSAGLPEIVDFADLTMLINGDPMTPETFQMHMEEMVSVIGLDAEDDETTVGEATRKADMSEEQVEALVEKRVGKRTGKRDH